MLVLGRKRGEQIKIGDDVVITVVRGDGVRLGIEAPPHKHVLRTELPEHPAPPTEPPGRAAA